MFHTWDVLISLNVFPILALYFCNFLLQIFLPKNTHLRPKISILWPWISIKRIQISILWTQIPLYHQFLLQMCDYKIQIFGKKKLFCVQ